MNTTTTLSSPSPLTVLFAPAHILVDDARDGSEYHLPYKLMERLTLDHGVRIIALTVQSAIEHPLPGVRFVSVDPGGALPVGNLGRLRFHLRVAATARNILAAEPSIDVIHHMYPFGFRATFNLLALLRRRAAPPIVIGPLQSPLSFTGRDEAGVSVRNFSSPEAADGAQEQYRRAAPPLSSLVTLPLLAALSAQTLRRADALVAYSERTAKLYGAAAGIEPERIEVITPGVDTALFTPRPREQQRSSTAPAHTDPVVVIAVGYLIQRKGFDVLVKAVGKLATAGRPVHLRLVGDGPARLSLERLVRQLGIEQLVTFAGLIPHSAIVQEYHQADIFCSMSLSESFSLVGLEAMSCGLPIVATPTGFFRDVLRRQSAGTLVPFGAVDELAATLARMITHSAERETLGRNARELATREYDWRIIAGQYLSLYRQVMRR